MSQLFLAFMSFGFTELMMIGIVALLVFGGELPDVMRNLGRAYGKFRQGLTDMSKPVRDEVMRARNSMNEPMSPSNSANSNGGASKKSADPSSDSKPSAAPAASAEEAPMPYVAPAPAPDTSGGSIWDNLDEPPPV